MHVGIYTGNYYPKVGGGYTFVKDIIEHLIMIAPNYENHFTIFTTSRFKKEILEREKDITAYRRGTVDQKLAIMARRLGLINA